MEPIYVFGHKNPDTDSIVSSIAYASLCNALGDGDYHAMAQGRVNDETAFLLKRFGFDAPPVITTVRTQLKDIDYDHPPKLDENVPVSRAWELFFGTDLPAVPVTRADGMLAGIVTPGNIADNDMRSLTDPRVDGVPVFNLLSALEGRILNSDDDLFDTISGQVIIALPGEASLHAVQKGSIVICGDQEDVVERALQEGASCVILCESGLVEKYRGISSQTCIITAPCDAYLVTRMIYQAVPVGRIAHNEELLCFHLDDFVDEIREKVMASHYRAYPVLDGDGKVIGMLRRSHLMRPRRKQVVLMDHNERYQSIDGLEQADIVAIIDHHRLADIQTGGPVFVRNEPVGSSTTIVATMYQERGLTPSPALAGLMAAAVLSDTVLFKSPTCTNRDVRIAERLARIAGIDLDTLGKEMFSAALGADRPAEALLNSDYKEFHIAGHELGVGQITCVDSTPLMDRIPELLDEMEKTRKKSDCDMVLLMLTDVLREGTELLFVGDSEIIQMAFGLHKLEGNHVFLPHVMSRKKQIVPALSALWG